MKTTVIHLEQCTLEEFADRYGLEMEVRVVDGREGSQFSCSAELKGPNLPWNPYLGIGPTQEEAIADYASRISGRRMEITERSFFGSNTKVIQVPTLINR
jgi:hypothetical protein